MKKYILTVLLFLPFLSCAAQSSVSAYEPKVFIVQNFDEQINAETIFTAEHRTVPFDQKDFIRILSRPGAFLLKLEIDNKEKEQDFLLASRFNFYRITLYSGEKGNVTATEAGYANPGFNTHYRLPVFPVTLKEGKNIFYAKVEARFLLSPEFYII